MSRSPAQDVGQRGAKTYAEAWEALYRMQRAGRSFSGHERHCAFLNTGGKRFADISAISGFDFPDDGRGLAYVDWDRDGDLDVWVSNRTAPQTRFLRNDTPSNSKNHFLAVRLVGRTCNRDAIGARVEVHLKGNTEGGSSKLIKTLYAGHGFLAQSSKWLHFGLGRSSTIDRVVVRWPGGAAETFGDARADRWYMVVQGMGQLAAWTPPATQGELIPSKLLGHSPKAEGRVVLATPAPLPLVAYHDFAGQRVELNQGLDGPTLVNLWASWCQPCIVELKHLADNQQKLREAGVRVVALSVDGLDEGKSTGPRDAQALMDQLSFPFDRGMANSQLLRKFQLLHDELFGRDIPHAVPTSFLVDGNGQLCVVIRGPLDVDRLIEDVGQLTDDPRRLRARSTPFGGRWLDPPPWLDYVKLSDRFYKEELIDDAINLLRHGTRHRPDHAPTYAKLGLRLVDHGEAQEAISVLRQALRLDQRNVGAHSNLGLMLHGQEKYDEAISHYEQALTVEPENGEVRHNLGNSLRAQGKLDQAIRQYQLALAKMPDSADTHLSLGDILLSLSRVDESLVHLQHSIRSNPSHAPAYLTLAKATLLKGRWDDSLRNFVQATRLAPDEPEAWLGVASILAYHPNPDTRDPNKAIQAGLRAAEITKHQDPLILDTLAGAYAAAGQFDRAVQIEQQALALASADKASPLVNQLRQRLAGFRKANEKHPQK